MTRKRRHDSSLVSQNTCVVCLGHARVCSSDRTSICSQRILGWGYRAPLAENLSRAKKGHPYGSIELLTAPWLVFNLVGKVAHV